jgi:tRNA G10  N-methylase Trm11
MNYFFILGSNPAISYAELSAVFDKTVLTLHAGNVVMIDSAVNIPAEKLIKQLGGVIKIGRIFSETKVETTSMLEAIKPLAQPAEGKYKFGFSFYGRGRLNLKPLGMELKKFLSAGGTSCRWVISREPTLSSVVVEQNGLLKNGAEFVLIRQGNKIMIGQTLAVQPFKELEMRDYGRPARDDLSGMLPPKLAQILINLARSKKTEKLLDPFCGSGTVLTEAALLGYEHVYGSDLALRATEDSKKNFIWVKNKFSLSIDDFWIKQIDATKISHSLTADSIDAIVTEPYLGPQRGKIETRVIVKELEKLYADSLIEFSAILKPGGRIVMIWPVFNTPTGRIMLSQKIIGGFKIVPPLSQMYSALPGTTGRQTLLYGREGQKVWREIIILEK